MQVKLVRQEEEGTQARSQMNACRSRQGRAGRPWKGRKQAGGQEVGQTFRQVCRMAGKDGQARRGKKEGIQTGRDSKSSRQSEHSVVGSQKQAGRHSSMQLEAGTEK